jgi:type I restriction enzyme S subunit
MSAPKDWKKGLLGEECSIEIGGTPSRNVPEYWDPAKETANAWVSIRDLSRRTINSTAEHISDLGAKRSNVKLQSEGAVLLSFKLSIGRVAFAGIPLYTNEAIAGLRSESINHDFLYFGLQEWDLLQDVDQAIKGATLNKAKLKKIEFHYPPSKPEQTKIAEILSTVDRAIEQTEALIAKQQRLKTGLMQDLLTCGIDEHGNLRSKQTHIFKDSPLGRIPVEWEVKRLGSLLSSINQGWSPDCESDPAAQGEWGVLRTTAVVWEGYQDHENKGLPPMLAPRPHLEIQAGDLLMTRAGPNSRVGVIAYVYSTRSKLMLSDKVYRLVPTKEADGRFLCYALSSSGSQRHLSNLKTGMAESQTNISQEIVKALMTVCPPSAEQSLIADHLDHISSESDKSTTVLAKLRSLKTALMQDLLTGRKRVTELLPD